MAEYRDQENGNTPEKEDDYRFMDQVIKRRHAGKRFWLKRILAILAAGVAVGLIASFVFSLLHPEFREFTSARTEQAKITIPPDEEPTPTATPSPSPTDTPTPTPTPTETPTPEPTQTPEATQTPEVTPSPDATQTPEPTEGAAEPGTEEVSGIEEESGMEEEPAEEKGITLTEYKQLHRDMMAVAEEAEHALVQVIGITSEMDYFNQSVENQRWVSGLIIAITADDLYVLTEYRVVDQVERIQVVFFDGNMTDATFQKADQNTGLAILKVPAASIGEETAAELQVATLGNSNFASRGEPILALGSPLGYSDSIAYGMLTSTSNTVQTVDNEYAVLTTDIDGSGDGSGVLVNLDGAVVGIISHGLIADNGSIAALAISQIKELIQDLSNNEPQRYVGIHGQNVTQSITDRTGIPRGVLITAAEQDSPAMLAGLKEYDVLVRIEDKPVETMKEYHRILRSLAAGSAVQVTAMRRGAEGFAEVSFEVTIESR